MDQPTITRRGVLSGLGAAGIGGLAIPSGVAGGATADRHIVGVTSAAAARRVADRARSVRHVLDFGEIGAAVAGRFSEEALEGLQHNPNVRYIEVDGQMHAIAQTLPWGIDRVDAEVAHANGETGEGAHIAIIDTGIDDDHPDLQANVGRGKAYVDCRGGNCNYPWSDDNDHGTHCAGIADAVDNTSGVIGVSTTATLHAVKVLDKRGSGSFSDVAAGIEYTADQGWDVGSMSLGASSGSQTVKDACTYAYNNGVLLVAAAGNDGPCSDCVGYPAAYSEVIAVSSTAKDDSLSGFSSTGPEVELAAPGSSIYSTVIGGYDTFSGTSMACPHVSGAGAQLMANGYTNSEARSQLKSTAEDIGLPSNEQGAGLLDAAAALGFDSSDDLGGDDGGNTAPSVDSLSASEVETSDGDAEFDVDWSVSDGDGNLSSLELVLYDDSDGGTEESRQSIDLTDSGDSASGTTRLVAAGDDGTGHDYTVEATVTDSDGASDSSTTTVSETEDTSGGTAPTVDSLTLSEDNSGGSPHAEFVADWAVSDGDGDLDTVEMTLTDTNDGSVEDSASVDVSGGDASGSTGLKAKFDENNGHEYEVELLVTDTSGNTASATATEVEDGS